MWDKLDALERRFTELNDLMSRPDIFGKAAEYQRYARERAELVKIVDVYQQFKRIIQEKDGVQHLLEEAGEDTEMGQLGREELAQLAEQEAKLSYDLKTLLLPADADDQKNVILEIRAGTGGEEAALFASDLVPYVQQVCGASGMACGDPGESPDGHRWLQGDHGLGRGPRGVQQAQI